MKLIVFPIILMFILSMINGVYIVSQWSTYGIGNSTFSVDGISENITVNGTNTSFGFDFDAVEASIDYESGIIALFVAFAVVAVVGGLNVLGSGLNVFSVKMLYYSVLYGSLWAVLGFGGLSSLSDIPVFGYLTYFMLTIVYGLGYLEITSESNIMSGKRL